MKDNKGFALIEVMMAFFLITLLGTLILLVYTQTIKKYDEKRSEKKAYILVNNIHQNFLSSPKSFYLDSFTETPKSSAGVMYFDEHLRSCGSDERFIYRVFYSVTVNEDLGFAKLYLSNVELNGKDVITDFDLGKMRITS